MAWSGGMLIVLIRGHLLRWTNSCMLLVFVAASAYLLAWLIIR